MDGGGDDAPEGGGFWHVGVFGDGELAARLVPPNDNVGFARVERAVDNGDVVVEHARRFPFVAAYAEHVGAGGVLHKQLVKIQRLQPLVDCRVGKPVVHAHAVWPFV